MVMSARSEPITSIPLPLPNAALPAAFVSSRLRLLLVEAALASPLRVQAPAVTADVPLQLDADGLRARWDDVRRELAALVEAFPPGLLDKYQSFTQADLARLRAAGYAGAFRPVEQGVAAYVAELQKK